MKILISGGGTGGHIFPAIAIANEIRRRHPQADILFVGAEGRMETERVPAAGYPIITLPVAGFDRHRLWRNFSVIIRLMRSLSKARKVLKTFKPDVCVGVGGYASGPMLKAAQKRGIPTLLQEQNSYAGVTNKLLAKKAKVICTAYEGMERFFPGESICLTGNPVRADILSSTLTPAEAKTKLGFAPDRPLVLVVGGSLGARTINQAIIAGAQDIVSGGAQILWQTGKAYGSEAQNSTAAKLDGVRAVTFISDMATAYRAADLVVARAGALTISELQLLGKAAILIPSPNVAENHQFKNASALSMVDAAILIPDDQAVEKLTTAIDKLLSDVGTRQKMSENILKMALPNAASKIVDHIENIVTR